MQQLRTKRDVLPLPCKLTEDEVRLRGIDLANATKEHIDLQGAKKEANKKFGEDIKTVNGTIVRLKDAVRHGVEVRDVDVEIRKNMYTGMATTVRLDTGEVVESRRMTEKELQGELDLNDEADDK